MFTWPFSQSSYSYKDINLIVRVGPNLNLITPKASSPNTITEDVRASTYEFCGDTSKIYYGHIISRTQCKMKMWRSPCLKTRKGNSLVVQWVGLHAFTAKGGGLIPGLGTMDPASCEVWHPPPKKKQPKKKVPLEVLKYKTFPFCSLSWPVIVFFSCYLMSQSLEHGDTCWLSADPHRCLGPHYWLPGSPSCQH